MEQSNVTALQAGEPKTFSLTPKSLDEAMKLSELMANSEMVPKDFRGKPGNVLVAVQMGMEIGLPPTQALQNIAVINGRPSLWGDAALAVVKAHPKFEFIKESFDDSRQIATCTIKRRGEDAHTSTFSQADAQKAGLWGKQGPWQQYPKRMMQMRARSFAIRDVFPDALKGISIAEEAQDIPPERDMGTVERVHDKAPHTHPEYPQDKFNKNLSTWMDLISSGQSSVDHVIATVESRFTMTEEQKRKLRGEE